MFAYEINKYTKLFWWSCNALLSHLRRTVTTLSRCGWTVEPFFKLLFHWFTRYLNSIFTYFPSQLWSVKWFELLYIVERVMKKVIFSFLYLHEWSLCFSMWVSFLYIAVQEVVDGALNDICILLRCSRHNLNVVCVLSWYYICS